MTEKKSLITIIAEHQEGLSPQLPR